MNEQQESKQFHCEPRRYTLAEIDMMRDHLRRIIQEQNTHRGPSGTFINPPTKADVEMRLRTSLLVGVDPKELSDEVEEIDRKLRANPMQW